MPPTVPQSRAVARRAHVSAAAALLLALAALLVGAEPAVAQDQRPNQANWPLADRFSNENLRPFVYDGQLAPRWVGESDSLFYRWRDQHGTRYMLVLPRTREKKPLFDHVRLAEQLSEVGLKPREAHDLDLQLLSFSDDRRRLRFVVDSMGYEYDLRDQTVRADRRWSRRQMQEEAARIARERQRNPPPFAPPGQQPDFRNFSPDSSRFVFARDHNLYVVDVARGDTVQITTDGVEFYSFGARDTTTVRQQDDDEERQGQDRSGDPRVRANVNWSPDSRAFAVTRMDSRAVGELYLVDVLATPRPTLRRYRYAMPGEENVPQAELSVWFAGEPELTRVNVDRWQDQRLFDVHWPVDAGRLRLVRRDRLQRNLELIEVAFPTMQQRVLLTESVEDAFLERQNVRYVRAGGDFLWFSERTGWGHYYLYDHDGRLKHGVTAGPWRADQVAELDSVARVAWISGVGREPGQNPYYRHLYRVNLDNRQITLLDPGDAHTVSVVSPTRRFIVSSASRVDTPYQNVLRDERGNVILELETQDVSRLAEIGWVPPEPFQVKAADGVTDIYGVMWRPIDFDATRKYPIIAHVYPGPQTETVTAQFSPNATNQRLAQLGFVVVQIGNRGGSPQRSNAYHSFGYYNLRDYGLADKKAGIEQLAMRHPWIDVDRVGIYGHSGGGFMTAAALLLPPYNDFFKVGVSSAGNHDNNVYNQNWSEQHHGLREVRSMVANGDDSAEEESTRFEIAVPTNHEIAENLKGRLLLVHGDMDNNVHPVGTIRLVDALIKANKRFDFMIMPGQAHGFGPMQGYFTRMMHEYFAEHLMGDYYRDRAEIR